LTRAGAVTNIARSCGSVVVATRSTPGKTDKLRLTTAHNKD